MDADAVGMVADVLLRRFAEVGVNPLDFLGGAGELAGECLDALFSPRTEICERCGGPGEDPRVAPIDEAVAFCPSCSGSGRIEKGPIAYLADSLEQVGTLTEDYIDGEWRGRIAGYMTTNAIATRTVPLLRVRPDESPKGGA